MILSEDGMMTFFLLIWGSPILALLLIELLSGYALDRHGLVRRKDSPREYCYLLIFHAVVLTFVVGILLTFALLAP